MFGDKTLTYDNNGNLTSVVDSTGTTLYSWNARNQLTGISGPGVNASFVYDGVGRREKKTINTSLTEFLYDGVNPVQETSGATVLANILTGLGIDDFFTRTDIPASITSHLLPDGLGSALALSDSTGVVQTEYTYEPFGRVTQTGAANTSSYQYTGRENDGTGVYYYRARYYHPSLQRFIGEDPIEFYGGDTNLYAYVYNDPLRFVDPFGLDKKQPANPSAPDPNSPNPPGPSVAGPVVPFPSDPSTCPFCGRQPRPIPYWHGNPPAKGVAIPDATPPPAPFAWPEPPPLVIPNVDLFRNFLNSLMGRNAPNT